MATDRLAVALPHLLRSVLQLLPELDPAIMAIPRRLRYIKSTASDGTTHPPVASGKVYRRWPRCAKSATRRIIGHTSGALMLHPISLLLAPNDASTMVKLLLLPSVIELCVSKVFLLVLSLGMDSAVPLLMATVLIKARTYLQRHVRQGHNPLKKGIFKCVGCYRGCLIARVTSCLHLLQHLGLSRDMTL